MLDYSRSHRRMHGEGFVDDAPFAVVLEHREVVGITLAAPVIDDLDDCDIESDFEHGDLRIILRAWLRRGPFHYEFDERVQRIILEPSAIMTNQKTLRVERAPQLRFIGVKHAIKIVARHRNEFGMLPFTLGW